MAVQESEYWRWKEYNWSDPNARRIYVSGGRILPVWVKIVFFYMTFYINDLTTQLSLT